MKLVWRFIMDLKGGMSNRNLETVFMVQSKTSMSELAEQTYILTAFWHIFKNDNSHAACWVIWYFLLLPYITLLAAFTSILGCLSSMATISAYPLLTPEFRGVQSSYMYKGNICHNVKTNKTYNYIVSIKDFMNWAIPTWATFFFENLFMKTCFCSILIKIF